MTFSCTDLDEALRDQQPAALEAARAHAQTCARCRESLEVWDQIAAAAPALRQSWESPDLWPRIHQALAEESQRRSAREGLWSWRRWRTAAAAAGLVAAVGGWLVLRSLAPSPALAPGPEPERRLLTERALREVERSEAEYVASIDRLAKVAEPLLDNPSSPLLASYREKVQLLDAAIADCRAEIDRNRFNAHLRRELLSIYQEKQRTLRALMEERS
ncbi:MAG: hypothetical protein DMF79_17220 [Acidobacteria bacterium]|nr:MAG: hypothetical protein DMF79_17220 [Acidobacteriota bacterium]